MRAGNSTLFFPISLIVCSDPKYFCTCYSTDDANESTLHYRFLFMLVDPVNEPYVKFLEHSFSWEIKDIRTTSCTQTIINNLHLFKLRRWRSCLERLTSLCGRSQIKSQQDIPKFLNQVETMSLPNDRLEVQMSMGLRITQ